MIFFLTLTVRGPFHRKDFKWKKVGVTGLISEKTEVLYAELNERAEAATGSYSVTGDSLQYIYSVPVTKNHRNIRSVFSWWIFLHRYIKEKFFVAASILYGYGTTYFYYEKLRRTMHTAIVSNLLKRWLSKKI